MMAAVNIAAINC